MALNSPLNSKLLYLPLRELQLYLNNLEIENEKLKSELTTFSRFNCILENIRRSSNKGFNSMQLIDSNKSCRCNEHLNGHLRRMAQEADIELRVWQEQYEKLILKTKQDYLTSYDEENSRSVSLSPRSSSGVSPSLPDIQCLESEPESTISLTNTNDTYSRNSNTKTNTAFNVSSRTTSISMDSTTNDSMKSSFNFENNTNKSKDKPNGITDESVIRYITLSPSADESTTSRSPPIVVYDSNKETKLVCDWPNCNRVFVNEEILIHHRRNHIRKSIYSCEYCSTRLLSKEELENHMKKHKVLTAEDNNTQRTSQPIVEVVEEVDITRQDMDVENTEAVNLSNKSKSHTIESNERNDYNCNKSDKNALTFQSALFNRLTANQEKPPTISTSSNCNTNNSLAENANSNQHMRPEEYKRTRYSGVGRYRCPWPDCGYTPHFLRDLRRHMYKHTGDKKHKCDYPGCDFVSVWKTSLLQHQRKKHFAVNHNITNTNESLFVKL